MMVLDNFIEWLQRQGHRVIKTDSSFWVDQGPRVYQAFPYHRLIKPSDIEIKNLLRQTRAIALRYSTSLDQPEGQLSYHVVYDRASYELEFLPKKARHDVIHGLKYACYEPITLQCLAHEGWVLRQETLIRQGRRKAESRSFWESLCISAEGLPAFEAWGALHQGLLVATLFAYTFEDTVSILYQQSLTQHLKFGINNALTYVFTHEVLKRPGVRCIFYGLHSLDAPFSVDSFKLRMNFIAKPVRQRVVFNPIFVPIINPLTHELVKTLLKIWHGNYLIAKAEGMIRFYLGGKCSLSEQELPEVLLEEKNAI